MNRPETPPAIPDVQSHPDIRALAIERVGIRGLRYPILFADGETVPQPTVASCSIYVSLPAERKGTHMSRLVAIIDSMPEPLSLATLPQLLDTVTAKLDAPGARCGRDSAVGSASSCRRPPVSGVGSLMDYEVKLAAELAGARRSLSATVIVPVMSLCPSSKAIADYGAHNQRSHLTLAVHPREATAIRLAELVAIAEEEASCELYGLLKRSDEKYVTERAYDRPRFVEDLVRGIAARLIDDPRLEGFRVEAENFESIHNHSAYAAIVRD